MLLYILEKYPSKTEHFIANEIKGLYQAGVNLQIIAMKGEAVFFNDVPIPVTYIKGFGLLIGIVKTMIDQLQQKWIGPLMFLRQWKVAAIAQVIEAKTKRMDIQHIHAHFGFLPADIAMQLSKSTGKPFSFTAHAQDLYANDKEKLLRLIKGAKLILTCTKYGESYLKKIAPKDASIHCIYHGVNLKQWPFIGKKTFNPKEVKVLFVGRLVEKKGIHVLLKAMVERFVSGRPIKCSITGSGPMESELISLVKGLGLANHVHFKGHVSHENLLALFQQHDLLICPSIQAKNHDMDGIPNVILEAMAVGLPVIASNISGIPEVISHGETGILVKPGDSDGINQHIDELMSDRQRYQQIRRAARAQLEKRFDLQERNKEIEMILTSAMAS